MRQKKDPRQCLLAQPACDGAGRFGVSTLVSLKGSLSTTR